MKYFVFISLLFVVMTSGAACVSATNGTIRYRSSAMEVCLNSWQPLGDSISTGDTCTGAEAGKMKYAFDNVIGQNGIMYCNASDWMSLTVAPTTSGACTGAGRTRYNAGVDDLEYCSGSTWYGMKSSSGGSVTICGLIGDQPTCDSSTECFWSAGSCTACPCKK